MVLQLDFAVVSSLLAIVIASATIIGWAIKEGERRENIRQMNEKISTLATNLSKLDGEQNLNGKTLAATAATMESLAKSIGDRFDSMETLIRSLHDDFMKHVEKQS